jgi:N-methylhydantoinase A
VSTRRWRVGVDIGGTFTDILAIDPGTGEQRLAKVPTVRRAPLQGIVDGLAAVTLGWSDVAELVHGTTMVTNALVEGKTAPVTLVTSEGFQDVLAIARQSRRTLYDLTAPPRLAPDVPAERCVGLDERLDADGTVLTAPDAAAIAATADAALARAGDGAIAVALLHSYANPAHERAIGEVLRRRCRHVSLSHEVSPEAREYERTLTTVLNASVMPLTGDYVERLAADVPPGTRVHLFHSAGGMTALATARERPLTLAMSGPAAGAVAAASAARDAGLAHALAFDMGGTTTDVSLIVGGKVEIASNRRIAGRAIRQPMVAIESVGAGGGSLVKLGTGGLSIGPESAGADPGPAVYGRGGAQPTLTDALALLGWLDPGRVLGGSIRLDLDAARRALQPIAGQLGLGLIETALGIVRVADATMARALRRVTIERGVDARGCALIAFGGAGPMHACGLAEEMGIARILVPAASGGFSALGCVAAAPSCTVQQTIRLKDRPDWEARFAAARRDVGDAARAALGDGAATSLGEIALVRYLGQSDHVEVPFAGLMTRAQLGAAFRAAHVRLYGYATDEPWEIEALRVTASGDAPPSPAARDVTRAPAATRSQLCHFARGGEVETPRLDRGTLAVGRDVAGPAIIEDTVSTIVVAPGWRARRDGRGNVEIVLEPGS